jgi:hypothetical protein
MISEKNIAYNFFLLSLWTWWLGYEELTCSGITGSDRDQATCTCSITNNQLESDRTRQGLFWTALRLSKSNRPDGMEMYHKFHDKCVEFTVTTVRPKYQICVHFKQFRLSHDMKENNSLSRTEPMLQRHVSFYQTYSSSWKSEWLNKQIADIEGKLKSGTIRIAPEDETLIVPQQRS